VQLPDQLVLLFTANHQSLYGALDVARRAGAQRNHLPFERAQLLALPVATRFEMRVEYKIAQEWLHTFARELAPPYAKWAHRDVKPLDLLHFTRTPYVPYWSFGERLPVVEEGTKDPESLGFALENVTAILAQGFSGSEGLVSNRDAFVEAARRGATAGAAVGADLGRNGRAREPVRIFISYSGKDRRLVSELHQHLHPLKRQGLIETWSDRQIMAGESWHDAIDANLERADLILLLVSPDFLASDYAWSTEVKRALERAHAGNARVVAILLRPTDLHDSHLAHLQLLPRNHQPLTTWANRDEAWATTAKEIRGIVESLAGDISGSTAKSRSNPPPKPAKRLKRT
jgi:hypothetical protein